MTLPRDYTQQEKLVEQCLQVTGLRYDNQVEFGIGGKTFFKNNIFQIQNSFKNSKVELMIMNPTNQELKIIINDESEVFIWGVVTYVIHSTY